jgi:hypothetical protein
LKRLTTLKTRKRVFAASALRTGVGSMETSLSITSASTAVRWRCTTAETSCISALIITMTESTRKTTRRRKKDTEATAREMSQNAN